MKTPEEKRAKLIKKLKKMTPIEIRRKLNDPKFIAKLEAAGIPTGRPRFV